MFYYLLLVLKLLASISIIVIMLLKRLKHSYIIVLILALLIACINFCQAPFDTAEFAVVNVVMGIMWICTSVLYIFLFNTTKDNK